MKLALLPVSFLLLLGAGCSPITIDSNSIRLGANDKVNLSAVTFEYSKWSKQDEAFLNKMKEKESHWRELITESFNDEASKAGINQGSGATVPVEISIVDLNPGSQAARYFVGFGAGTGTLRATARAGEGEAQATGAISGGGFGGSFDKVIRALGIAIAGAIAETRK